jgi:hypothetical protein
MVLVAVDEWAVTLSAVLFGAVVSFVNTVDRKTYSQAAKGYCGVAFRSFFTRPKSPSFSCRYESAL